VPKKMLPRTAILPSVRLPEESITERPGIRLDVFKNSEAFKEFKAVFAWCMEEIQKL
jgi:hypothetical protein